MRATTTLAANPVTVTAERVVDDATAEALWDLNEVAFRPLEQRAAARQLLTRDNFDLEVLDRRVVKYLARAEGRVVGLCTITNELETVPWISPNFYETRFPDHFRRGLVFYCGLAMVHPDAGNTRAFARMVSAFGRDIAHADGILVADMCRYNIDVVELAHAVTLIMRREWGGVEVVEVDRQVYMAWEPPTVTAARGVEDRFR
jgi:hypothetical protein